MGAAVKPVRTGSKTRTNSKRKKHPVESPLDRANGHEVAWSQVSQLFDAARRIENPKFVYFIGEDDDGPIKIGVAKDPVLRLRSMQTGNSRRLRIEHVLRGDMAIEKLLHEMWEPSAIVSARNRNKVDRAPGTEWFQAEIREELFPIIATAAGQQVAFVSGLRDGDLTYSALEKIVREAHRAHGHVPHRRDEVLLLGAVAGYHRIRPSRV